MSQQLNIFDSRPRLSVPVARRDDPATSHAAADAAAEMAKRHHATILYCLQMHGPLGKDGIAKRTPLDGIQIARRLCELSRAGLVRPTGKNVPSAAGRAEREWEAR